MFSIPPHLRSFPFSFFPRSVVQADVAQRREQQREKERIRQRDEIEQLKKDKLELDRRLEAERQRTEDRRAEERRRIDLEREKLGRGSASSLGPLDAAQDKSTSEFSPNGRRGDEKEVNPRDRVLNRKQEKQAREEQERLDALREAEADNRRIRQAAQGQRGRMYEGNGNYSRPSFASDAKISGRGSSGTYDDEDDPINRYRPSPGYVPAQSKRADPMDVDELTQRLNDVTRGQPRCVQWPVAT